VAKGDGIKGSWTHGALHMVNASKWRASYPFSGSSAVGIP
jgi:hypothetical protein